MKNNNLITKQIANKIKQARTSKRYTQKCLGDALGVSSQQIQKYESATNSISIENLVKLASFLNISLSYFLDDLCTIYKNDKISNINKSSSYTQIVTNLEEVRTFVIIK